MKKKLLFICICLGFAFQTNAETTGYSCKKISEGKRGANLARVEIGPLKRLGGFLDKKLKGLEVTFASSEDDHYDMVFNLECMENTEGPKFVKNAGDMLFQFCNSGYQGYIEREPTVLSFNVEALSLKVFDKPKRSKISKKEFAAPAVEYACEAK